MAKLRSYLLESCYRWIEDHQLTPYVLVDASIHGVVVPESFIQDGKIVLNMSFEAIEDLSWEHETISFIASFSDQPFDITIPNSAVLALYAKESGVGMFVNEVNHGMMVNEGSDPQTLNPKKGSDDKPAGSSKLRIIK
jgi:stringent starvation protein B